MSLTVLSGSDSSTYTAAQAAQLLGVSERRVRQLVDEGRLPADRDDEGRLRLPQRPVHAERTRRRKAEQARKETRKEPSSPPPTTSTPPPAASVDVEALVERIFAAALPRAIEAATATHRTVEAQLSEALAAERAARADAEARAAAAEAKAAQLEQATATPPPPETRQETPRRSWLQRGRR
jgi:excisionase family DNA binding protein